MPTVTLNPTDDCTLDMGGNVNGGSYLAAGSTGRYLFFMKFDLASLAGKIINSAKFTMYCYASGGADSFYVKKVAGNTINGGNKPATGDTIYTGTTGESTAWHDHASAASPT
jgi:hypothetical protein